MSMMDDLPAEQRDGVERLMSEYPGVWAIALPPLAPDGTPTRGAVGMAHDSGVHWVVEPDGQWLES